MEHRMGQTLSLKLRADNAFYSQGVKLQAKGLPVTLENLAKLPAFYPCLVVDGKVELHKTGMGSSAALITSLVGCLAQALQMVQLPEMGASEGAKSSPADEVRLKRDMLVVHNLAQVCHAVAQGKVGSGFDVSAAVYGSHVYTRFPKSAIEGVISLPPDDPAGAAALCSVVDLPDWGAVVEPVALPEQMMLLMGDVCGGSATPSMVREVLRWRDGDSSGEAMKVWAELGATNSKISCCLKDLYTASVQNPPLYRDCLSIASELPSSTWRKGLPEGVVAMKLAQLSELFAAARVMLRNIGEVAGVPIEPSEQTELVNATLALPGVLCAGVPGAGGYDAVFAVTLGRNAMQKVQELWLHWGGGRRAVCPLLLEATGCKGGDGIAISTEVGWT
ncbi:unnamed protein product [Chrysoparadoxa australica]